MSGISELDNLLDALNERRITPAQGPAAEAKEHTKALTLSEVYQQAYQRAQVDIRKGKASSPATSWLDGFLSTVQHLGRGGA